MHGGQAERQTLLPETHTALAPRPQTLCTARASEGPLPACMDYGSFNYTHPPLAW